MPPEPTSPFVQMAAIESVVQIVTKVEPRTINSDTTRVRYALIGSSQAEEKKTIHRFLRDLKLINQQQLRSTQKEARQMIT